MNSRSMLGHLQGVSAAMGLRAAGNSERIEVGGSTLDVSIDSDTFELGRTALLDWVTRSAKAVTAYFGRFPVAHARVHITVSQYGRVSNGVSFGDGGPRCRISVGHHATLVDLYNDWELTHEMIHFGFPSVDDRHRWIEEGIATYVEPIGRAQVGDLSPGIVWRELVDGLPKGLPAPGDRGLDITHTWGRTYWGGALFCLMADVEIHQRTNNRYGLQDALRGIVRAGGNMEHDWPLARALKAGDDAIGVPVLMELYDRMKATPVTPDLSALWHELGVRPSGDSVVFDQSAPLASVVRSIMARRLTAGDGCAQAGVHPRAPADSASP